MLSTKHQRQEYLNKTGERKNAFKTSLMGMTRKQLAGAQLPLTFWGETFKYSCFHKNRLPCYANPDNQIPYFTRFGKHPDYSRMQPFGQACVVQFPKNKTPGKKIGDQGRKGIMVDYDDDDDGTKAYRIYVSSKRIIVISPDVDFMPYKAKTGFKPDASLLLGKDLADIIKQFLPNMCVLSNVNKQVEEIYSDDKDNNTSTTNMQHPNTEVQAT